MAVTINTSRGDFFTMRHDKGELRKVHKAIDKLQRGMKTKVLRDGLMKGSKPMVTSAKQKAPKSGSGLAAGSRIKARLPSQGLRRTGAWRVIMALRLRNPNRETARVGVGVHRQGFYLRFHETGFFAVGSKTRSYKAKSGKIVTTRAPRQAGGKRIYPKGTRWIPPHPFLRPSFHEQKDNTVKIFRQHMWQKIKRELPKGQLVRRV